MYFIFHDGIHTKTQYVRNRHCSCHGRRSEARKRDKCAFLHTSFKTKKCANVVCTFVFDVYTTIEWHGDTSIVSVNVNFSAYFFVCVCFFFFYILLRPFIKWTLKVVSTKNYIFCSTFERKIQYFNVEDTVPFPPLTFENNLIRVNTSCLQ